MTLDRECDTDLIFCSVSLTGIKTTVIKLVYLCMSRLNSYSCKSDLFPFSQFLKYE